MTSQNLDHRGWSTRLRTRFLGIGMCAVAASCLVFALVRGWVQWRFGLSTPWMFNAIGALAIAGLYLWYRRDTAHRNQVAVHSTAAVATILLIIPVAYGMASSAWWLTLVGFAMTLMSNRREALLWALGITLLMAGLPWLAPLIQVADASVEPPIETYLARMAFAVILFGVAYAFRREIEQRTADLFGLNADLRSAHAAREQFLAHMSHELRTPLHGILGMTEHVRRSIDDPQLRAQLDAVRNSGETLLRLINDVLEFGHASSEKLQLDHQRFCLHECVTEVLLPFAAEAREKGLQFTASAAANLPAFRIGDRARVQKLLRNLLSNALKFTDRGSVHVELSGCDEAADGVILRVADTGIGMPYGFAESGLAFQQGDCGPRRAYGGAGLGLAMVRELAGLMHGHLSFEPGEIRGSIVQVGMRLALSPDDDSVGPQDLLLNESIAPISTPEASPSASPRSLRILLCEDDPLSAELMTAMLQHLGHQCVLTSDGLAGLQKALDGGFDLALSDIEMPIMDGYELLKRLREHESAKGKERLPILAVTAHASSKDRARFLALGFDDYLAKPFSLASLQRLLQLNDPSTRPSG